MSRATGRRYVTPEPGVARSVPDRVRSEADTDSTTVGADSQERFRLFRLCPCAGCNGIGRIYAGGDPKAGPHWPRCSECRGEGRVRQEVAACATPQDVGVALVTLGREGEFAECPFGLLDSQGEKGRKWLVLPWLPSPRNVSDAGRLLAKSKGEK